MAESPEATLNFRDLAAGTGRRTRFGVLFRSDTLQALTDADVALPVERIGLEAVIDLRVGPEAVEQGRGPLVTRDVTYLNARCARPSRTTSRPRDRRWCSPAAPRCADLGPGDGRPGRGRVRRPTDGGALRRRQGPHVLDERFGGARGWASARGIDAALLDRFPDLLTEPVG